MRCSKCEANSAFLDKSSSAPPPLGPLPPNTRVPAERCGAIQVCQATRDWKAQSSLPFSSFGNEIKFREWLKGREWINDLTLDRVIIKPRLPSPDVTWDDVGSQSALLWIRISLQSSFFLERLFSLSWVEFSRIRWKWHFNPRLDAIAALWRGQCR